MSNSHNSKVCQCKRLSVLATGCEHGEAAGLRRAARHLTGSFGTLEEVDEAVITCARIVPAALRRNYSERVEHPSPGSPGWPGYPGSRTKTALQPCRG